MIPVAPHIAAMSPYALAEMEVPAGKSLISLSQNESLRAPSPLAAEAAARAMTRAELYPDPDWTELCQALGDLHGIPTQGILCGNGSLDLIGCVARAYADEKNAVLAPAHAYPFFRTAAQIAGARFDTAEEDGARVSVSALLAAVQPDTRVVFVANPGNPTGTRLTRSEIRSLRAGLRDDVLLVVDEAYGEFADHLDEPSFDMVTRGDTVILRTFSKAYGLAGLRVGWGLFPPEIAAQLRKVMNPNNISVVGQAAALAAVEDQAYMCETCTMTARLRDSLIGRLRDSGFRVADSFTNFALIRFDSVAAARSADQALQAEGVFPRSQAGAGLSHALRVTVGNPEALDLAVGILKAWSKGARP